jgi:hypothetical protein
MLASLAVGLLAAAFGAAVAAFCSARASRRNTQIRTAFEMHREYFQSLIASRDLATRFLEEHRGSDLAQYWRRLEAEEMRALWDIVYFYERLWAALENGYLSPKLFPELFGDSFNWWYVMCLEHQLVPLDDPIGKHLANLHGTLMTLATPVQIKSMEAYLETWQLRPTSIDSSSDDRTAREPGNA